MGRLHHLTQSYQPEDPRLVRADWAPLELENPHLHTGDYAFAPREASLIGAATDGFAQRGRGYGLIHYDFHPYNF